MLVAAKTLIRAVQSLMQGLNVRVLIDGWYMRRTVIEATLKRGFNVIGQVRKGTRLYDAPAARQKGQRGRSRKYEEKYIQPSALSV
ncbi:DDE superfamily endonuclease [Nitrosomonas sp. Nm51]|nr:DDE superfamily endonuclease [Nitrosomonas sp. Nm51]